MRGVFFCVFCNSEGMFLADNLLLWIHPGMWENAGVGKVVDKRDKIERGATVTNYTF